MDIYFVSPIQNWKSIVNPANLSNPLDYYMNFEEIDQQLYAVKMGWA